MKRLYAATALIILLSLAVLISTNTVNKSYDYFETKLNECENAFKSGNAINECNEFQKEFEEKQKTLCIFINRAVLDNISICAARMTSAAKQNSPDIFYSELAAVRLNFYKLKTDENFSVISLF